MISKHIKKKFLIEFQYSEEEIKQFQNATKAFPFEEVKNIKKKVKDKSSFMVTDTNKPSYLSGSIDGSNLSQNQLSFSSCSIIKVIPPRSGWTQ